MFAIASQTVARTAHIVAGTIASVQRGSDSAQRDCSISTMWGSGHRDTPRIKLKV